MCLSWCTETQTGQARQPERSNSLDCIVALSSGEAELYATGPAHGKDIRDEWNSGYDWSARISHALNANTVFGTLPYMTSWAFNLLMVHRSEIMGGGPVWVMISRLLGVRAHDPLQMQEVWADAQRRIHLVLHEEKGTCEITQIPHQVLLCVLRCS